MGNKCKVFYNYIKLHENKTGLGIGDNIKWHTLLSTKPDVWRIRVNEDVRTHTWFEKESEDENYKEIQLDIEDLGCIYINDDPEEDDDFLTLKGKVEKIELMYVKYRRSEDDPNFLIPVDSMFLDYSKVNKFERCIDGMIIIGFVVTVSDYTAYVISKNTNNN